MERFLPEKIRRIHFIGIGGIGMSGLANLLIEKGYKVSGSDIKESEIINRLRKRGVRINIPHNPKVVRGKDLICFSSAIKEDNPEIKEARILKIPLIRRGSLLAKLLREKRVLAIAGSHGKTTTTSLASFILKNVGLDLASLVGGIPCYSEDSAWWGKDLFVVETDESDASFLELTPTYSIITNIDREHLNFYKSFSALKRAFLKFARRTKDLVIGWADQDEVYEILKLSRKEFRGFGFSRRASLRARDISLSSRGSKFKLFYKGKFFTNIEIPLLGKHNILNTLSVLGFCFYLGYKPKVLKTFFKTFPGTRRRLEIKGVYSGITFIDDYAHHPREIENVVRAVSLFRKRRLVVVFQPHRFSRIKSLIGEFSTCFRGIDLLIITDIYPAGETAISGVDIDWFITKIKKNFKGELLYIPKETLKEACCFLLRRGDCFLSLGAGDINKILDEIVKKFRRKR